MSASISYSLLLLRWHGDTNRFETLYIVPGYVISPLGSPSRLKNLTWVSGFGCGIVLSAVFISMQASVEPVDLAPAISTLYLLTSVGSITGVACLTAINQYVLKETLHARLLELGLDNAHIISVFGDPSFCILSPLLTYLADHFESCRECPIRLSCKGPCGSRDCQIVCGRVMVESW